MISGEFAQHLRLPRTVTIIGLSIAALTGCIAPSATEGNSGSSANSTLSKTAPMMPPSPPSSPNSAQNSGDVRGNGVELDFKRWPYSGDFPFTLKPLQGQTIEIYGMSATTPQGRTVGHVSSPTEIVLECVGPDFVEVSLDSSQPTVGNVFIGEQAVADLWRKHSEGLKDCQPGE